MHDEHLCEIAIRVMHGEHVVVLCRSNGDARAGLDALDETMQDERIPHRCVRRPGWIVTRDGWVRFVSARGRGLRGLSADMVLINGPEMVPDDAIPIIHAGAELQWAT